MRGAAWMARASGGVAASGEGIGVEGVILSTSVDGDRGVNVRPDRSSHGGELRVRDTGIPG